MYRVDSATAVASRPAPGSAGTEGWFGDSTIVDQDIMNCMMGELENAVLAAGLTPSKTDLTQLSQVFDQYLLLSGGNITGSLGIGAASPVKQLHLAAGGSSEMEMECTSGQVNYRSWNFLVSGASGAKQGFALRFMSDDGLTSHFTALSVDPNTGQITMQVPTQSPGDDSNSAASTAYADAAVAAALASATIKTAVFNFQLSNGSNSGETLGAATWTTRNLNTTALNTISGASLSGNTITLPAGSYTISAVASHAISSGNANGRVRLRDTTHSATLCNSPTGDVQGGASDIPISLLGGFVLTGSTAVQLQSWLASAGTGGGACSAGEPEIYASVQIAKIA